jgi:hypothetical protein
VIKQQLYGVLVTQYCAIAGIREPTLAICHKIKTNHWQQQRVESLLLRLESPHPSLKSLLLRLPAQVRFTQLLTPKGREKPISTPAN